jgi:hypothetical protein
MFHLLILGIPCKSLEVSLKKHNHVKYTYIDTIKSLKDYLLTSTCYDDIICVIDSSTSLVNVGPEKFVEVYLAKHAQKFLVASDQGRILGSTKFYRMLHDMMYRDLIAPNYTKGFLPRCNTFMSTSQVARIVLKNYTYGSFTQYIVNEIAWRPFLFDVDIHNEVFHDLVMDDCILHDGQVHLLRSHVRVPLVPLVVSSSTLQGLDFVTDSFGYVPKNAMSRPKDSLIFLRSNRFQVYILCLFALIVCLIVS